MAPPFERNDAETRFASHDISAQPAGATPSPQETAEAAMIAHIVPTILGILAPLGTIGWVISRGI